MKPITVEQWEECYARTGSSHPLREKLHAEIEDLPNRFELLKASYETWCEWCDAKDGK